MSTQESRKFARYEVIGELGRGSMGVVYKARDPVIGRMVAIKSIPETFGLASGKREEFIKRLRQEAMTAGRLQHPNIVTIFDVGETADGPFIAMEYLDGVTLRDVITAGKKVTLVQLVDIIAQVAAGLDYAHGKAIIHRDIKPANLMIVADNRIKIMDLGIARIPMSELTKEGKLVGSPSYMSPEQLSGKAIDGRSDLFSLGVCIYQLMTFRKPFPGEAINEICYRIVHADFLPPTHHVPELPPEFDDFMMIALAKDPGQRFQTGAEMAEAVAIIAGASFPELSQVEGREREEVEVAPERPARDERSDRATSSNPTLTQTSNIDSIFKDLTDTARTVDLRRQDLSSGSLWRWYLIAAAGGLALVALIIYIATRS
jgi:eukaryotic-like serine/threonine-protein kinase